MDPAKIQAQLDKLNAPGQPGSGDWIAAAGYSAVTSLSIEGSKITFNPNLGIPAKVFVNKTTGEMKIFDLRAFNAKQE